MTINLEDRGKVTQEKFHAHDCDKCDYLGSIQTCGEAYDLYVCVNTGIFALTAFIARFGEDDRYISLSYHDVNEAKPGNILSAAKRLYLKSTLSDKLYFEEDTTYA
jgi:hypothetical protein